jgi:hypothetical protein
MANQSSWLLNFADNHLSLMITDIYYLVSEHHQNLCLKHTEATTKGSHVTIKEFTGLARNPWWIDASKNTII